MAFAYTALALGFSVLYWLLITLAQRGSLPFAMGSFPARVIDAPTDGIAGRPGSRQKEAVGCRSGPDCRRAVGRTLDAGSTAEEERGHGW